MIRDTPATENLKQKWSLMRTGIYGGRLKSLLVKWCCIDIDILNSIVSAASLSIAFGMSLCQIFVCK